MRTGVIVAGGYSTRFGEGDKAVADLAGTPMSRRVADRLAPVIDDLVLNCRPEQRPAIEDALTGYDHPVTVAADDEPDRGPMTGILTGLRAAESEFAVVVACDMPFVDPALVRRLFERARDRDAAVPRVDGRDQPLQAVYHVDATVAACEAALARDQRAVFAALNDLDWAVVQESEIRAVAGLDSLRNVNTREDLRLAATEL
ncbi:molybdenum cofactor guanylyltransferase [Halorientalis halophila]|uniref:molybdenum cofactor guanylyltransferase n=1 Tax=Halorientalis halophila TaxID=3108499 RepID=UPI0030088593